MTSHAPSSRSPSEALPTRHRLTRRSDFIRAYEGGRKFFSRHAVIFSIPNELDGPRLGITATKKVGKAHVRNRLKRRVREIFRRERTLLGLDNLPIDFVVNVKRSAVDAPFEEFRLDLVRTLRKASKLLAEESGDKGE